MEKINLMGVSSADRIVTLLDTNSTAAKALPD
jgi:hypothetical protein